MTESNSKLKTQNLALSAANGSKLAQLPVGKRTPVMGMWNMPPARFAGGGLGGDVAAAVRQALEMQAAGGDDLNVGGMSTASGSEAVPEEEEERRVVPLIARLAREVDLPLSVDTYRA